VDGAAAALVGSGSYVKTKGIHPLARIVAVATVGVPPELMSMGPAPAIRRVLEGAGLRLEQIDRFEINEAFAAQLISVERELQLDRDKLNVNGGRLRSAIRWRQPACGWRSHSPANSGAPTFVMASPRLALEEGRVSRCCWRTQIDYSIANRVKLSRSARTSSPRSSRRALVTNSAVTLLRQVMSKSVLSSGLAMRAARAAASAMDS